MKTFSTPSDLMETINAFRVSRIILTGYELCIFDHLTGNGLTSEIIAIKTGSDPRATDRLLNAMTALGLITKTDNYFRNTPFSDKFLVTTSPFYMKGIGHYVGLWQTWNMLTESVKTGKSSCPSGHAQINDREDLWLEYFIAAMHARGVAQGKEMAALLDLSETKKTLDVGGGSGAFTFAFIEKNPDIESVILDLPNVVPITQRYINEAGLQDKVKILAGDYHISHFGKGYDLILMSAIAHINNPEENLQLIRKGAESLNPGGQLVIMDFVMNDSRTEPFTGALFALNMLVGTEHGDSYTESEYREWMELAGLINIRLLTAGSGMQMMIGEAR